MATDPDALLTLARECLERSYAPYSRFPVAAAVVDDRGRVFTGVNVENISYGLSMCAERVAIFTAVAAGARRITALAVTATGAELLSPCGACRQVVAEFAPPEIPIYCETAGKLHCWTLAELLPHAFAASQLGKS
ncbi:MAG TPA: cytidine deaminase [Steroidobacteraceae bacterium]|nr:cytidine deaminase [Steroidobacteraceae bacterium]